MSFHPSLPDRHHLMDLWRRFPRGVEPLLALHDAFLRNNDSALEIGERELIAAHVSAMNGCHYCYVAHRRYAMAFGIDEAVFGEMTVDTGHASLRPSMTAVLDFAAKLTQNPAGIAKADYDALMAQGWDEDAIHDIICVTSIYALMNRLLEGSGQSTRLKAK